MMPVSSGSLSTYSLADVLRALVNAKQTGYLKFREGEHEGYLAMENGIIINAGAGTSLALHALFQFVGWREAGFEFQQRSIPSDMGRELAVYDPQVLIAGVAFKEEDLEVMKHPPSRAAMAKAS